MTTGANWRPLSFEKCIEFNVDGAWVTRPTVS